MARRELQEINAGSMADIAFLLLIFFLVSTTMETDKGILRILPPIEKKTTEVEINPRNLLKVNINYKNEIKISGINGTIDISQLRGIAKNFIEGKNVKKDEPGSQPPEMVPVDKSKIPYTAPYLRGNYLIAKDHVIQLKNDRGTSYEKYIQVQNELTAAYREVRDEFVQNQLSDLGLRSYADLEDPNIRNEIETVIIPRKISESDPVNNAQLAQ